MSVADVKGRAYAQLDQLKPGDVLIADGGFTCLRDGDRRVVELYEGGQLYIACGVGKHFLDGQNDGDGFLVGLYPQEPA